MVPKRVFWLAVGWGAGIGTSYWAARKVRSTMERYSPEGLTDRMSDSVGELRSTMGEAVREGRAAMRSREAELRSSLGAAPGPT